MGAETGKGISEDSLSIGATILFPLSETLEARNALFLDIGRPLMSAPISVTEIILVAALRYIAELFGAGLFMRDPLQPGVGGEIKESLGFRYPIMTHRPKSDLVSSLMKGLAHCENLAHWLGNLPCAMLAADGIRPLPMCDLVVEAARGFRSPGPTPGRIIHDPDRIAQE